MGLMKSSRDLAKVVLRVLVELSQDSGAPEKPGAGAAAD